MTVAEVDAHPLTDEALAALALAADPEVAVDPSTPSLWELDDRAGPSLLPSWYHPTSGAGTRRVRSWKARLLLWLVVATLLAINALGLCVTYGRVVIA